MGVKVGQPIKKSITIIQMVQFGLLNAQVGTDAWSRTKLLLPRSMHDWYGTS